MATDLVGNDERWQIDATGKWQGHPPVLVKGIRIGVERKQMLTTVKRKRHVVEFKTKTKKLQRATCLLETSIITPTMERKHRAR